MGHRTDAVKKCRGNFLWTWIGQEYDDMQGTYCISQWTNTLVESKILERDSMKFS